MKYVFIPAKLKREFTLPHHAQKVLVKEHEKRGSLKIALSGSIQFVNSLPGIKAQLDENNMPTEIIKGSHSVEQGQVVGCDYFDIDSSPFDILLYIGDGLFHPKAMMLANDKEIYGYNPLVDQFQKLERDHMDKLKKIHRAAVLKFLHCDNIGVLVTIKPGQNRSVFVPKLKAKFPDKNFYVLVFDTVDYAGLEDFNFVDMWVNTTCPRIAFDDTNKISKPICNINDLLELNVE